MICSPSSAQVNSAYSTYPLWFAANLGTSVLIFRCACPRRRIAIGAAVLFLLQIVLLSLLSSCWELRRTTKRSLELLEVRRKRCFTAQC